MEKHSFTHKGLFDYQTAKEYDFATPVFTLFLNDSSLVIKEEKRVRGLNRGWFYKHIQTNYYRCHTNKHGEKYLTVSMKATSGLDYSQSSGSLHYDRFLYELPDSKRYCAEMIAMIESHISKLLGFTFAYKPAPESGEDVWYEEEAAWETAPETLCYPFLRVKDNQEWMMSILQENAARRNESTLADASGLRWDGPRGLVSAWRSSETKEEFIANMVYKSAIKTEADLECLMADPSLMRLSSNTNLKMGVKEAVDKGYAAVFKDAYKYMSFYELHGFRFLLSNLPNHMTVKALDFGVQLVKFRKEQEAAGLVENLCKLVEKNGSHSLKSALNQGPVHKFFKLVPASDKQQFAVSFFEEFQKSYFLTHKKCVSLKELETFDWKEHQADFFIKVMDSWLKVYAAMYLKTTTSDSIEQCSDTAVELFGVDLSKDKTLTTGISVVEELDVSVHYYDFRKHVSAKKSRFGYQEMTEPKNLFNLFRKGHGLSSIWISAFDNPSSIIFKDYLQEFDYSLLILASDLEKIFRKIAVTIDKELVKVGQPLTPENRMFYLEGRHEQTRYKSSWRYYHMGVPVKETPLYKKAGFKSKKDILYWLDLRENLPTDIYEEFLNDAANGTAFGKALSQKL